MVRAKFQVTKVAHVAGYGTSSESAEITLAPQYDESIEEDRRFSKATPSGTIQLYVSNPAAVKARKFFYVYHKIAKRMYEKMPPPVGVVRVPFEKLDENATNLWLLLAHAAVEALNEVDI